jgi:hypothetical protein
MRAAANRMANRFRIALLSGAAALAVAGVAIADVSGLVGNTILRYERQHPELVVKLQLNADGSFQALIDTKITATGAWEERDGKLCFSITSKQPPGRPSHFCAHGMDGKKVGDSWLERWDDGHWYKARVVAGHN